MPTILCPACTRPTTLPDPWPHPSYTCPHCGAVVALAAPAPPPPPPTPVQHVHYTHSEPAAGEAFGTMFRGSLGCFAAMAVVLFGIILACSGAFSGGSPTGR
jgi:hypothetical protein